MKYGKCKDATIWGRPDDEALIYTEPNELIENILDSYYPGPIPRTIIIQGFAPREMPRTIDLRDRVLEDLFLQFKELYELGNPDGDSDCPQSDALFAKLDAFIDQLKSEYRVYAHVPVGLAETVDCVTWVKEHRPDWQVEWGA